MIIYNQEEKELQIPQGLGNTNLTIIEGGGGISREEVQEMIDDKIKEIGAVTEDMVDNKDEAVKEWVEENYATKDEIPSLDGYATEEIVEEKIENSLTGYATEEYVQQQIIEAGSVTTDIVEGMIDDALVDYYTQTETDAEIAEALNEYYTKQEVDDMIPEVKNFATKDELQEVENTLKDLDATQIHTNISTDIFDFDNVEVGLEQITQAVEYQGEQLYNKVDNINGVSGIWQGTKAQYDALASHSNNVLYILKG